MPASFWIDLLLAFAVVFAAYLGWRRGVLASGLSILGIVLGAVTGVLIAPYLVMWLPPGAGRAIAGVAVVIVLIVAGQEGATRLGAAARDRVRGRLLRAADAATGAAFHAALALGVAWLVALPLTAPVGAAGDAVRGSQVLAGVGDLAPAWFRQAPARVAALLDTSRFSESVVPIALVASTAVAAPDAAVLASPVPGALQPSVLRVHGAAPSCDRTSHGSAFVVAPERLMTNAHVVAGAAAVVVDTPDGPLSATVVGYDPGADIAVLAVPGLTAPPLTLAAAPGNRSDDAIVLGYPANGPYTAAAARIRGMETRQWHDIYRSGTGERQTYAIRGSVRSGDSGGPLVDPNGRLLGMVFGSDDADTGYVLTLDQLRPALESSATARTSVGTGRCAPLDR